MGQTNYPQNNQYFMKNQWCFMIFSSLFETTYTNSYYSSIFQEWWIQNLNKEFPKWLLLTKTFTESVISIIDYYFIVSKFLNLLWFSK